MKSPLKSPQWLAFVDGSGNNDLYQFILLHTKFPKKKQERKNNFFS